MFNKPKCSFFKTLFVPFFKKGNALDLHVDMVTSLLSCGACLHSLLRMVGFSFGRCVDVFGIHIYIHIVRLIRFYCSFTVEVVLCSALRLVRQGKTV